MELTAQKVADMDIGGFLDKNFRFYTLLGDGKNLNAFFPRREI